MASKKILVPVDFSECSVNALKTAIHLSERIKAELLLLHTYNLPVVHGEMGVESIAEKISLEEQSEIKEEFEMLKKRLPRLSSIPHDIIIRHGSVKEVVRSLTLTEGINMVIMGTKGVSGIDEVLIGSNSYEVVKDAKCPVLVVPEKSELKEMNKIALASDYKQVDEQVLQPLKLLVWTYGAEIHILHISDHKVLSAKQAEEARKFDRYFHKIEHHYHLEVNDDVEEGITEYCKKRQIDILALVPRKHHLFDRIFGGGETKNLVFHAEIPILALTE